MSNYWQKADGKCHHCKEELPIGKHGTEKILYMTLDTGYQCSKCDEINSWQDPRCGWFSGFIFWLGRTYW